MNTKKNTYDLAITGLFIALVLILGMTPVGLIPLGFINLTILHIPVILGTILLGFRKGLILGACFGIVSAMSMLGLTMAPQSALAYNLLVENPMYALIMCIVPRLLVPTVTWLVQKAVSRGKEKCLYAVPVAAVAGSVTNTVFYLGFMYLFYCLAGMDLSKLAEGLGVAGLGFLGIIGAIAAGGGGMEALAAGLISPPVAAAVWKIKK